MEAPAISLMAFKVLVLPEKAQEKIQGGIIIPTTANRNLEKATVVMLADGVINLQPGDTVLYPAGAGTSQEFDGIHYKILNGPTTSLTGDIWVKI